MRNKLLVEKNIAGKTWQEIKACADSFQINNLQPLTLEEIEIFFISGNRSVFEKKYFERRKYLTALGIMALKDSSYLSSLENMIWAVCNEFSWCLPAHYPVEDGEWVVEKSGEWIDLFAAETAQTLSEIKRLLGRELNDAVKKRIDSEIEKRILEPFEAKIWHWETLDNNWNAVINGCIGMMIIAQLNAQDSRKPILLERVNRNLNYFIDTFPEDGACVEGLGYWAYGYGYFCYYAELYQQTYHKKVSDKDEKLKKISAFPWKIWVADSRFVPFSDYNDIELPTGLLSYLKEEYNLLMPLFKEVSSFHSDHCYRWAPMIRNMIWTIDYAEHQEPISESVSFFEEVQWLVAKFPKNQMMFAAKGGHNMESHNHRDIGNFVLGTLDCWGLDDLGAGEYTRQYFDDKTRYNILNNRSLGHNVPLINGIEQRSTGDRAQVLAVEKSEEKVVFSLEIAQAYPEAAGLRSFVRTWEVEPVKRIVNLEDYFEFLDSNRSNRIRQNFVSRIKPCILESKVEWNFSDTEKLILFLPESIQKVEVITEEVTNHFGKNEMIYLTQFEQSVIQGNESMKQKFYFKFEGSREVG